MTDATTTVATTAPTRRRRLAATTAPNDRDAVEIGRLYRKAKSSLVESVRYQIKAGYRLKIKKDEVGHGHWLEWLEANTDALEFEDDRTARRLMAAWKSWRERYPNDEAANRALTSDLNNLDHKHITQLSRVTWGNDEVPADDPQPAAPQSALDPTIATLVDAAMQLAGPDVVVAYINGLDEDPNTVSRQQFKQAARAVEQELPAQ